jgi:hypothetical protein
MAHRLTTQPYELALQAGSMPVNENASRRNWLIDGSFHAEKLQNWLSGASNCVLRALLPLHVPVIHNYQLSMVSRDFCPKTNLALPEQCCQHTHQKQEIFALLNSCPSGRSRGENEKMETSIFSVFNLKKIRPYLAQDVNRGFLALALRKSSIDILSKVWYPLALTPVSYLAVHCSPPLVRFLVSRFLVLSHEHGKHKNGQNYSDTKSSSSQPRKKGTVSRLAESVQAKACDNTYHNSDGDNQPLLAYRPRWFVSHSSILSSPCMDLVYNNAERFNLSGYPRRLVSGAEQVA